MKELVGKQVQNKAGDIATVTKTSVKDVTLEFEDGSSKKVSLFSFKRNWEPLEDSTPAPKSKSKAKPAKAEQEEELLEDETGDDSEETESEDNDSDEETETEDEETPEDPETATEEEPEEKPAKKSKPKAETKIDPASKGIFDTILDKATDLGCELKETDKYTAIKFRKKNIAELHLNKQGVALVVSSKSLSDDLNKQCEKYPDKYNWVLNTKFTVTSKNAKTVDKILEAGINHVNATKPTTKGEQAKAEKESKKSAKPAKGGKK